MAMALKTMGWIFFSVCLVVFLVDFLFYLKKRYCRYHIGRWEKDAWEKAVEKRAYKWLKHTPVLKITDNSRYILIDMITGKYKSSTIQSWQRASLFLGISKCTDKKKVLVAKALLEDCFDADGMWKEKPTRVDCGMLSFAALKLSNDPQRIKPAMDYSLEIIKKSINSEGLISYAGEKSKTDMYVDTIGLTIPFLITYAKIYGNKEYEKLGYKQLLHFHEYGFLKGTYLPNHAYDCVTGLPLGVYGWGRGTGWYVLGLIETLEEFTNPDYRKTVEKWIYDAAEDLYKYQHKDGGFGSILQKKNTYDSSATAIMAFFYAKVCSMYNSEKYHQIAERCVRKLIVSTRLSGAVDWCQGDTKDIGIFSQAYDTMPFVQGITLRCIYELCKN